MSEPTIESPYGPADPSTVPPTGGAALAAWVEKGRRVLLLTSAITGALSVVLLIVLIVLVSLGGATANNDLAGLEETITWVLIFGSPVLFVIALNLLVWRSLLRPLGRMASGARVGLIVGVALGLALVSVIAVVVLLSLGFVVGIIAGGG